MIKKQYTNNLREMISRVQQEPKLEMIYSGIKEKSIGVVFGPSKAGKTMFCENLGMSIAAGVNEYLWKPIKMAGRKVLFVSLEEYYANRTERNEKQAMKLSEQYGTDWLDNYIVVNENIDRYLNDANDWNRLAEIIIEQSPDIAFVDSLTHMYSGSIEDSKVAIELTKNLRYLGDATGATIVAIHHTHKMYGQPLSIDTIAGSRVLAQELDFMIGLNRTSSGSKYIKDVAFRYIPSNDETVYTYEIDNDCWLNLTGETTEAKLLAAPDGRKDNTNMNLILDFFQRENESGNTIIPTNVIEAKFVDTKEMSKPALHSNLRKLISDNIIIKPSHGEYRLAA
ncbi:MAG: AAA family ATPase [Taibaiella sp.]|nr:AAA family ATPase [Taibaiella sp.]